MGNQSPPVLTAGAQGIGQLAERSLHAGIKDYLYQPGDEVEVKFGRYVIDLVRDDLLIEIQTRHLYALRPKLRRLLDERPVLLVHPLAQEKWIVREDGDGRFLARRKSPRRGALHDIFKELVRVPDLLGHPNLTLQVLLTRQEEIWRDDGQGSWRRGRWSVADRRLLEVVSSQTFADPVDLLALLPAGLAQPFTNRQLAAALRATPAVAQKITYTLRRLDLLDVVGKDGRAHLYATPD